MQRPATRVWLAACVYNISRLLQIDFHILKITWYSALNAVAIEFCVAWREDGGTLFVVGHLWADCLEKMGTSTSHNPMGIYGLLQGYHYLTLHQFVFIRRYISKNCFCLISFPWAFQSEWSRSDRLSCGIWPVFYCTKHSNSLCINNKQLLSYSAFTSHFPLSTWCSLENFLAARLWPQSPRDRWTKTTIFVFS
jgi:hypothetical protein